MNKHDELIARINAWLDNYSGEYSSLIDLYGESKKETDQLIKDAADLLQLYGDALVRLGDEITFTPIEFDWEAECIERIEYAQTTVEGE